MSIDADAITLQVNEAGATIDAWLMEAFTEQKTWLLNSKPASGIVTAGGASVVINVSVDSTVTVSWYEVEC